MSESEYHWMIVYEDGTTDPAVGAYLEEVIDEIDLKDDTKVIAIIRTGLTMFGR